MRRFAAPAHSISALDEVLMRSIDLAPQPTDLPSALPAEQSVTSAAPSVILSFDVEEHYRIEAASHLSMGLDYQHHCQERVDVATRWLLEMLGDSGVRATFFIVGQIARDNPRLVKDIAADGH